MGNVILGHASISENGTKYGKAGDQTGKEVCIREYYDGGSTKWKKVFRWKDAKKANKAAKFVYGVCLNELVGYSQVLGKSNGGRESLDDVASKVNYDASKIKIACNCDCSSFMACACRSQGLKVSAGMGTSNEVEALNKTGEFYELDFVDENSLQVGDILWRPGHTAMVISVSNLSEYKETVKTSNKTEIKETNFRVRITKPFRIYKDHTLKEIDSSGVSPGVYTIVSECEKYRAGKLKSGAGWIDLSNCIIL